MLRFGNGGKMQSENLGNSDKMPKENLENKGNFTMSVGDGKEFNAANIAKNLQGKITKAEKRRLELFGNFVNKSLKDRNFNNFFEFGRISAENAKRLKTIKNDLGQPMSFNLENYLLRVDANAIRHIYNEHPQDLDLLNNLYDIYHNFDKAQWNYARDNKTGKNIVAISFFKTYKDGTAKAVEIEIFNEKELRLKTLFRMD